MQNSAVRIPFSTLCSVKLAARIPFGTCGGEIDKNEEEILKIQEFSKILSMV